MGAPSVQGLTAKEAAFVGAKLLAVERGKPLSDMGAAELAGYGSPQQRGYEVATRPHVQKALRELLATPERREKCVNVLDDGLQVSSDDPVKAQAERRRTVETIARLTGELADQSPPSSSFIFNVVNFVSDAKDAPSSRVSKLDTSVANGNSKSI